MWHWYRLHQKTSNFTLVTFEMSTGAIISSRVLIQTSGTNQETSVHTHTDKECCVSYRTMIWVPNRVPRFLGARANTSTHTHTAFDGCQWFPRQLLHSEVCHWYLNGAAMMKSWKNRLTGPHLVSNQWHPGIVKFLLHDNPLATMLTLSAQGIC